MTRAKNQAMTCPRRKRFIEQPSAEPVVLPQPGSYASDDTWLVMLYQDADDKILEQDIYVDLNEAERVGSSDNVQIVAQVDRYQGGFQGDGNWTVPGATISPRTTT